jgi:DNA-binding transcriptional ArsR family regulator
MHSHQDSIRNAKKALSETPNINTMAETFKVLGDPTRLRIVVALGKQELCVLDLAAALGMTDSAISHQLRLLKALRIVKSRKDGKLAFYSLDDEHIDELVRLAKKHAVE